MLQLNADQTQALGALKRERDLRALRLCLAEAFADVATRAGERFEALIAHGTERGIAHGLTHSVCLARYLACWFTLGAEFESRPEFAWARALLGDAQPDQGGKVFQLCRRTRESLVQPAPGQLTAAAFDAAITRIDAELMPRGDLGSLLPTPPLRLGQPCDLDAVGLKWLGPPPMRYRCEQGQWQRAPGPMPEAVNAVPGTPLPAQLHALAPPAGAREPARLQLRTLQNQHCDPATHPLLSVMAGASHSQWRGRDAANVTVSLLPEPEPEGMAAPGSAAISRIAFDSCGLRDSGAVLGAQTVHMATYPATQHLLAWQRATGGKASLRRERDGLSLGAERWQAGFEDLDRQLREGLARLANAWERESGVTQARCQAEPAVLIGSAGLSWGWAAGTSLAQAPHYRLAGVLDLVVCRLALRLAGELRLLGTHSRLALHCASSETLQVNFESSPAQPDAMAALSQAQTQFRQPLVLHVESLVGAEAPALLDLAGPPSGGVVGACGLRLRSDAPGLEWFCELSIEPVSARLIIDDPVLGTSVVPRPLLPALKLIQWSLH